MTQWTEARTVELIKRWQEGQSASYIAKVFGTSSGAVMGRLRRLGIVRHHPVEKPKITLPKISI